jgi:hypothetical protein
MGSDDCAIAVARTLGRLAEQECTITGMRGAPVGACPVGLSVPDRP